MFDQCLKFLILIGFYSAVVVRGEDYYDYSTTSTTSLPTTTSMTETSWPATTQRILGRDEFDLDCARNSNGASAWWNDPSANQSWLMNPFDDDDVVGRGGAGSPFLYYGKLHTFEGNSSFRLISPLYSRVLDKNGCISTSLTILSYPENSRIRLYQKPDYIALEDLIAYSDETKKDYILFEVWSNYDDVKEAPLKHFDSNFQLIFEAIFDDEAISIYIGCVDITQSTDCAGNTGKSTTTMSTTTTERPMQENGDTTTDEAMISDEWVDSPYTISWDSTPTSPLSNLWPTTTQPTTMQTLHEGNEFELDCALESNGSCAWWNDPSAKQAWLMNPLNDDIDENVHRDLAGFPFAYQNDGLLRGVKRNSSFRLISPLYSRVLDKNGCFSTFLKTDTSSETGFLRIRLYQKPDYIALEDLIAYSDEMKKDYILFEVWDHYWNVKEAPLKQFDSNFQLIFEAIFYEELGTIAISCVSITQSTDCAGNTGKSTTTMSTTTTERPMRENDSPPASPPSNLWPTTTRPTTTQTLQEGNGFNSRNTQMISIISVLGGYRLNDPWANIVGSSLVIDHEAKPSDARYSTNLGGYRLKYDLWANIVGH